MKAGAIYLLVCLIVIALKMSKAVAWSWWLVLAPAWVPVLLVVLFAVWMVWVDIQANKSGGDL